jgi:hypothetical protein
MRDTNGSGMGSIDEKFGILRCESLRKVIHEPSSSAKAAAEEASSDLL